MRLHPKAKPVLHCASGAMAAGYTAMESPILKQSDFQVDCGRRLKALLGKLDLKQTEAARIMGVSKHVVRNWIAGDNPIGVYPLYRLCRAKNVNFDFIFLGIWTGLRGDLAAAFEAEALASLAAPRAGASQEDEPVSASGSPSDHGSVP